MSIRLPLLFLTFFFLWHYDIGMAANLGGTVVSHRIAVRDVVITAMNVSTKVPISNISPKHNKQIIDQKNREFIPHISVVRTGSEIFFPNSDNIKHHVYSFSPAKRFEIRLYEGMPANPVVFDKPGMVTMGCNIHDWMLSFIFVTDAPYYTQTDTQGRWSIDLPDGEYQITIWHPYMTNPEHFENLKILVPSLEPLYHSIDLKTARPDGKPPSSIQLEGYYDGF